jgi:hypothetical protein
MSTRLEGVQIPVELDTSKAQRQLDQLEGKLSKDSKKAVDLNRTLSMNNTLQGGGVGKGSKTGTTGAGGVPQEKSLLQSAKNVVQGSTPVSGVFGKIESLASRFPTATALAQGAGAAGVLYGAVRTIAMNAPLALEAGRAAVGLSSNDPLFKAVQDQLGNLRNSVNYLESYVKSAVTGIGKTYDMATAMARVNGKVPNLTIGYGIYREADLQEDMLQKKFDEFKQREVAEAVATSMVDFFKGGINR